MLTPKELGILEWLAAYFTYTLSSRDETVDSPPIGEPPLIHETRVLRDKLKAYKEIHCIAIDDDEAVESECHQGDDCCGNLTSTPTSIPRFTAHDE